jgi:hypothetical protein
MKLTSHVEKPRYIPDSDTLSKHMVAIGKRIIKDAENGIAPSPTCCRSITITANIAPETSVTTIEYHVEEYADPRVPAV